MSRRAMPGTVVALTVVVAAAVAGAFFYVVSGRAPAYFHQAKYWQQTGLPRLLLLPWLRLLLLPPWRLPSR